VDQAVLIHDPDLPLIPDLFGLVESTFWGSFDHLGKYATCPSRRLARSRACLIQNDPLPMLSKKSAQTAGIKLEGHRKQFPAIGKLNILSM
jgi:hypothetical protein